MCWLSATSQTCDSNYYSIIYKDQTYINYTSAFITPDNGILATGSINYYSPWLTKFTQQGNVIWSNLYKADFTANGYRAWTDLEFCDAVACNDSSYFVAGSVYKHGQFIDNTEVPPGRTAAMLLHIDKYGNILWSKFAADPNTYPMRFIKIISTREGDLICYLITGYGSLSYDKIVCFSAAGDIKWITVLNTGVYTNNRENFKRTLKQTANGNIIVANEVYVDTSAVPNPKAEFHFLSLNNATGKILWESSYQYPIFNSLYLPDIAGISEQSDGYLSFFTNLKIPTNNQPQPTNKIINIITDNTGNLKNIFAYYPLNGQSSIIDAKDDISGSNEDILMNDGTGKAIFMQIDNNAQISRVKKFGNASSGLPPVCFTGNYKGYDIFLSDSITASQLLVTAPNGDLDCDTTAIQMVKESLSFPFYYDVNNITTTNIDADPFFDGFFVSTPSPAYPLVKSIECQKNISCCTDVIDTTNARNVSICEGSTFTLPDQTIVGDSGTYYVSYTTSKGCDSISYYKLSVIKNPADLMIVKDTCLKMLDTITLHATDGYEDYMWNDLPSASSYYIANQPGIYRVTVTNMCGTKTDSSQVYENCDFPIYMPSAFTPNGDGRNDIFRVPSQNKNKLIRLLIYNRWGQLLFITTNISEGWDGTYKVYPEPSGTYIYYLEMSGLTGKKISQKGTIVLIR